MEFSSLENLFTDMVDTILITPANATEISLSYPLDQPPECSADTNIVFVRLLEKESDYSKPLNTSYTATESTVIKHSSRTIVWEVQLAAYGSQAHQNISKLKDGVFRQDIKQMLAEGEVFLVPDMQPCLRVTDPTVVAGLNRWDVSLLFNQLHKLPDEDVGRIEHVAITTKYNN